MSGTGKMVYAILGFNLGKGMLGGKTKKNFRVGNRLLIVLVGISALYFWMQVEFIAAVQIVVYVGGIVVLIIFSIFLTQQSGTEMPKPTMKPTVFSVLAALFGFGFSFNLIDHYGFVSTDTQPFNVSVSEIGTQMLSTTAHGYILPFEVVSMLLLSAMIGCIVIAMKTPEQKAAEMETIIIQNEDSRGPAEVITPHISEPLITEEA